MLVSITTVMLTSEKPPTAPPPHRSLRRMSEAADAARRVIVRKGLEATTLRDISREGGFTTGVLMHYFADKRDVIVGAFAAASDDWLSYAETHLAAAGDLTELIAAFIDVAIPDDERREEWRLWAEMWSYAGRDPEFAEEVELTDSAWREMVAYVLRRCREAGVLRPDVEVEIEAKVLTRLIDGLGLRAWLADEWGVARECLRAHLGTLGLEREVAAAMATTGLGGQR